MNKYPLNEKLLLVSLPEFSELTEEEVEKIHVVKVVYKDHPQMFSFDLIFEYQLGEDRKVNLKFEMMGNRGDDHFYRHILYEDYTEELEFFSFKEAVLHFNQLNNNNGTQ